MIKRALGNCAAGFCNAQWIGEHSVKCARQSQLGAEADLQDAAMNEDIEAMSISDVEDGRHGIAGHG